MRFRNAQKKIGSCSLKYLKVVYLEKGRSGRRSFASMSRGFFLLSNADESGFVIGSLDLLDRVADGCCFFSAQPTREVRFALGVVGSEGFELGDDSLAMGTVTNEDIHDLRHAFFAGPGVLGLAIGHARLDTFLDIVLGHDA